MLAFLVFNEVVDFPLCDGDAVIDLSLLQPGNCDLVTNVFAEHFITVAVAFEDVPKLGQAHPVFSRDVSNGRIQGFIVYLDTGIGRKLKLQLVNDQSFQDLSFQDVVWRCLGTVFCNLCLDGPKLVFQLALHYHIIIYDCNYAVEWHACLAVGKQGDTSN